MEVLHRRGVALHWERDQIMGDVVLIADDDRDIVRFVALNLRLEGFEVIVANDGQDALDMALDAQPSLILLDTMMPRLDGYEVCSRLRHQQLGSPIPVIMLTAKSLAADRAMAFTAGADDWVTKPFDPADLVSKVKHRLRP
jgi:DNA-binding response OmpR family regulator